jgi:hypothetical protein
MVMFQKPDRVTFLYGGGQARHVRMNQPHPARVTSVCKPTFAASATSIAAVLEMATPFAATAAAVSEDYLTISIG